jgi:hypothetical protein
MAAVAAAHSTTRGQLFSLIAALAVANALAEPVRASLADGIAAAFINGFGVSWVVWLAAALMLRLSLTADDRSVERSDWIAAGACIALLAIPIGPLAAVVATAVGIVVLASRQASVRLKAAAMILVGLSVNLLWARLALRLVTEQLEFVEAKLITLFSNATVNGNVLFFVNGGGDNVILQRGCTCVAAASMALLLWLAITRSVRPRPVRSELGIALAIFLSVVVINTTRIIIILQGRDFYHLLHDPNGAAWINALILLASLAWTLFGLRREILH